MFNITKSNIINNYRYCFPCFAYLIKICYDKDRILLKQRKLFFFHFLFFLIKNFLLQCISKRLSSFAFLYHLHFCDCIMSFKILCHWLYQPWEKYFSLKKKNPIKSTTDWIFWKSKTWKNVNLNKKEKNN